MQGVTIVTAWYSIPSKFAPSVYKGWMEKFFRLPMNIIVFTDAIDLPLPKAGHVKIIQKKLNTFVVSQWDRYWEYCLGIDVERNAGHSVELYKIWNEKPFLLAEAAEINPFNSEWFAWCDIGCVRDDKLADISVGFPFGLQKFPKNKMVLSMVGFPQRQDIHMIDGISTMFLNLNNTTCCEPVIRIQGGFFAGQKATITKYVEMWRAELQKWMSKKIFTGKDQYMMYNLLLNHPDFFSVLPPDRTSYINEWFTFLPRCSIVPIFSAKIVGGLGNQMFQVAAASALALQHKGIAIFNRTDPCTASGDTPRLPYWTSMFQKCLTYCDINVPWQIHSENWQHSVTSICPTSRFTKIEGYFQSSFYFKDFVNEIKGLFEFPEHVKNWAKANLQPETVAIHVRLGDYEKLGWVLPSNYFVDAMDGGGKNFLVFSDDPVGASRLFPNLKVVNTGDEIQQMCLMSMCESLVMSNSSFSWWAAFLGNHKKVFAPDPWFPNASYCPQIYEPQWIKIKSFSSAK
jgi:hypothetical protein